MVFKEFSAEQNRIRANLASYYDRWLDLKRVAANVNYRLSWKTVGAARYLYEIFDRAGNGRSLGRESAELLARYERFQADKQNAKNDLNGVEVALAETTRLYAALNLPMVDAAAGEIFRQADVAGMMGPQLIVVGTNAMAAYEMEAGARAFLGLDTTADCDLAFRGDVVTFAVAGSAQRRTLFSLLRSIDATYTRNTERTFQARNRKAYEVELLAAPSVLSKLPPGELVPIEGLIEQEWLLNGDQITQVVCGLDRKATRIVCPDPRWMALHKAWLAQQPKRGSDKRKKDAEQAVRLFALVKQHMPHLLIDDAFTAMLPSTLVAVYAALNQ
jgi:hypothetical protein